MNLGTAHVIRANSRNLPLADNSVDLVVTSPPYFALRSYQDGCKTCADASKSHMRGYMERYCPECKGTGTGHYDGQIGDEPTPAEFVESLLDVTRECVRVLKPSGSLWVNLGDKYAGSRMDGGSGWASAPLDHDPKKQQLGKLAASQGALRTSTTVPTKSLIGIPWRYALRCVDDLGLILRAEVIWSKPNGLPESVTDRVRRSHEVWFHFVLQPRYFSAVDEIREGYAPGTAARYAAGYNPNARVLSGNFNNGTQRSLAAGEDDGPTATNPLGKLPGSVWQIPTEPLRVPDHLGVDHFAAFPTEWPKRIIQGWSPAGVCTACGEGRRPVSVTTAVPTQATHNGYDRRAASAVGGGRIDSMPKRGETVITGYTCACSSHILPGGKDRWNPNTGSGCDSDDASLFVSAPPTTPAVVLDPFGGTGTTAMVAKALGRTGITVDMSADYCRLAEWRTNDRDQLAKVLGIDKAPPVADDEQSLFDLSGELA